MANDISAALVPVLLLLPIVDWVVTITLLWLAAAAEPPARVLTERAFQAVIVSLVMSVFAVIFLNTQTGGLLFDNEWARAIGRIASLILGFAPILWLVLYLRTKPE